MPWIEQALLGIAHNKIVATLLCLILAILFERIVSRSIARTEKLTITTRRRWIVNARNAVVLVVFLCVTVIWLEKLQTLAAALAVIAVALVIATKEFLLNILGFFARAGTHSFKVGDRIEIESMRGDVIDHDLMGVTMMEIGPGVGSHQYTGRSIYIPNSKFISSAVMNESFMQDYIFQLIRIPLRRDEDWQATEQALLEAARTVCEPYLEHARRHMTELETRHGMDAPSADPRVHLQFPEPGRIDLLLRVPSPARRKGRIEQAILRKYLDLMQRAGDE